MKNSITRGLAWLGFMFMATVACAQDKAATMAVDGKPVLKFTVPAEAKVTSTNGYLGIVTTNLSFYVWSVAGAKTVADAVPMTAQIIKTEFVIFKTTSTMDMTVANAPAKHVIGAGNEADDNDPGHAEVVFFVVGGHVFAGCVHGEAEDASKARPAMLEMLKTAGLPDKN